MKKVVGFRLSSVTPASFRLPPSLLVRSRKEGGLYERDIGLKFERTVPINRINRFSTKVVNASYHWSLTSSFKLWSLSSRPRASSFVLRYCESVEAWTLLTSATSCLFFESSRRNARRSTSAACSRWVKLRMWFWRALIVLCGRKEKNVNQRTSSHCKHGSSIRPCLKNCLIHESEFGLTTCSNALIECNLFTFCWKM